MAVAVATLPHASQMSNLHSKDAQDALLDALLSSCEKPTNPPLESFGRELKPYFPVAEGLSVCAIKTNSTHKKSPRHKQGLQPVASAAAAAAASTKLCPATAKNCNAKAITGQKKGSMNRTKASPPRKLLAAPAATSIAVSAKNPTLQSMDSGEMAAFLSWAGPGFYVAPNPDKVPLPSTSLLV